MSEGPIPAGVAFTRPAEGDMRGDPDARHRVARRLGIPEQWATVGQVHGGRVELVDGPGVAGPADALVTTTRRLPLAVFTADCLGVVLTAPGVVGVAHAGWRGLAAGVLEATTAAMEARGSAPEVAHIGPAIGACCFEVGDEVTGLFVEDVASTTWGTPSVDLVGVARRRLPEIRVITEERCTACGGGPSHRRDGTAQRLAAVGWLT